MIILKYYRDGNCYRKERFENKKIATEFKIAYEKSYTAHQKNARKIYCMFKKI